MLRGVGPLLGSAHIEPSLAVTLAAMALALGAGLGTRALLVACAVGAGQLSIGWSNDWLDARRDLNAGRADKPVAQGYISARTVAVAAMLSAVACVIASLALGSAAGTVHLVAVAAGWFYNLRAKHNWYSVVPWALAFGLLPAVVTLTRPLGRWPAWWVVATGAVLGAGAHFANALPDLDDDRAAGVHGLPHRLGRRRSLVATLALIFAGTVAVSTGSSVRGAAAVVGGLGTALLIAVAVAVGSGRDRLAFRGVVALLLLLTFGLVASGTALY